MEDLKCNDCKNAEYKIIAPGDNGVENNEPSDAFYSSSNLSVSNRHVSTIFSLSDKIKKNIIEKNTLKIKYLPNKNENYNENIIIKTNMESNSKPLRSNLKRRLPLEVESSEPEYKKRKGISFNNVTVYYFPRIQGFSGVPSQGGSTLGMETQHTHMKIFTLLEHANEQRKLHRQLIQQHKMDRTLVQTNTSFSSDESDSEEEPSDASESEMDFDNYHFLQPVPARQRRALLRAAGVNKIDTREKDECRNIRSSREFCGCACKEFCDPDTCSCNQAGIKCQVDRLNFPCGCSRDNCGNLTGRIEFNPFRVRTHYIHTIMRLELEKKQKKDDCLKWKRQELVKKDKLNLDSQKINYIECNRLNETNKDTLYFNSESLHKENKGLSNLHFCAPGEEPGAQISNFSDNSTQGAPSLFTFKGQCYTNEVKNNTINMERNKYQYFPESYNFTEQRFSNSFFLADKNLTYSASINKCAQPCQLNFPTESNSYEEILTSDFVKKSNYTILPHQCSSDNYGNISANSLPYELGINKYEYTNLRPVKTNCKMSNSEFLNCSYNYSTFEEGYSDLRRGSTLNKSEVTLSKEQSNKDEHFVEIIKKTTIDTV
ncbi:unnamed protein product [Brassicogethes aeneus]|uniref:Cysteine/serine-rich nuclear protein N-terminal domain-containing protein n=1 Tax=Brassicogethes aeneus TaxID=1431903 RepID=A0A9P0FH20_BRAAE|nr:unnamed protein product [Brassicogethes aeneus]